MKFSNFSIKRKIGLVILLLIIFDIISYSIVVYNTNLNSSDSKIANVIGRNRFLSQKITTLALGSLDRNTEIAKDAKKELQKTLRFFERNLKATIEGSYAPSIHSSEPIKMPKVTGLLLEELTKYNLYYLSFKKDIVNVNVSKNDPNYDQKIERVKIKILDNAIHSLFLNKAQRIVDVFSKETENKNAHFYNYLIFIAFLNFITIGIVFWVIHKYISKPLVKIKDISDKIAKGNFNQKIEINNEDEIGQISHSINVLIENIDKASVFADNIGKNQLDITFQTLGENDTLGNSLLAMRDNLAEVADKENKRNWVNEGLAKFTDIIRDTENVERFYNAVLSNLIRYINGNQGYLYVMNEEGNTPFLEVKAVYAYGKQRYLEEKKIIHYKQGLVGQAWFDKEPLYFTEIPQDFVNITSGMGEATPTCVFIVPLIVNEQVHGVIEIASFDPLETHQMEFVTKLSETIASTVSNVKTNERTKYLLEQSQQVTEEMRAQEEEMLQNMEEMQATQAEMTRKEREMTFMLNKMQKQEVEMNENIKKMEEMQVTLQQEQEKNKQKAQNFKKKMETLDEELEGKKAELFKAKKIIVELEQKLASTN
jgi:HAMP domain-containing protein